MFDSIFQDLKNYFRSGTMISRIIIINGVVFLAIILTKIVLLGIGDGSMIESFTKYISLNESMVFNFTHPWVFVTHAFTHFSFFHILFNMLWLYWFGRILGDLLGDKHILPIYILGIIAGIVFFWISANYVFPNPGPTIAYGASAAVMAIIVAAGFTSPDYTISLIFIGPVRIKYIVLVLIILDLLAVSNLNNTGGHLAHLGGALMGGLVVTGLRNGYDLSTPIDRIINKIVSIFEPSERRKPKKRSPLKVSFKADERHARSGSRTDDAAEQYSSADRLDEILDKIKQKGMASLSKEEKDFLENQSKN